MKTKIVVGGALILLSFVLGGFVKRASVDIPDAKMILAVALTCAISGIAIALWGTIESFKPKRGGK